MENNKKEIQQISEEKTTQKKVGKSANGSWKKNNKIIIQKIIKK